MPTVTQHRSMDPHEMWDFVKSSRIVQGFFPTVMVTFCFACRDRPLETRRFIWEIATMPMMPRWTCSRMAHEF